MTARGGKRDGAGRKPGSKNKVTAAREAATKKIADEIKHLFPDAFDGDAHAWLMMLYKGAHEDLRDDVALRIEAAKAALPYEKPRLQSIVPEGSRNNEDHVPLHERLKAYAREEAIEASGGKVVELKRKPAAKAKPRARAKAK